MDQDPDPGGPKTCGSGGSGSATLDITKWLAFGVPTSFNGQFTTSLSVGLDNSPEQIPPQTIRVNKVIK